MTHLSSTKVHLPGAIVFPIAFLDTFSRAAGALLFLPTFRMTQLAHESYPSLAKIGKNID